MGETNLWEWNSEQLPLEEVELTGKRFSGMTEMFDTLIGVQTTFLKIHQTVHLRSMVFVVHIPQLEMEEINKQTKR